MNRHQRRAEARLRRTSNDTRAAESLQLGLEHHQAGRLVEAEACYQRVLALESDHADALHLLGVLAYQSKRYDVAVEQIRNAISQNGENAAYWSNLGLVLRDQGKSDEAIAACRQAIRIRPDYAEAYSNLGAALRDQGKLDEAAAAYRQVVKLRPDYAEAFCNLGAVLFDQGKLEESIAANRQVIVLKPDLAKAHNNLGLALTELGRLAEGRAALEQAVQLAPRNTKFRRDLAESRRFTADDPQLAEMEGLAKDSASLSIGDRIELHFALAKAFEDVGRNADAFHEWLNGNALKRRQVVYNEAATLAALDHIRSVFTAEMLNTWQHAGQPSSVPVFIVGMPRSGTTLIEQIIASHSRAFGGGELKNFPDAVKEIGKALGGSAKFPDLVSRMTADELRDLAACYLAAIERLAPAAERITDKMPNNFMAVGLIHLALPNATIIHAVRNPVDTCVSCFSKLFPENQNHTYDLAELGRYYRGYWSVMEHWHRVLPPGRILDVRYEDVVADLEGQARRIIAHCGLDWDPRCLDFHRTQRAVRTASKVQVRQPIYDSAVGRRRAYAPFLGPLLAELGDAGNH